MSYNISRLTKEQCCGCSVCETVCPIKSIHINYDKEGFLYPIIDQEKCISCGKCIEFCPQYTTLKPEHNKILKEYIAYADNINEVEKSASGSIASALYKSIIKEGGYIVGVRWKKSLDGCAEYYVTNSIDDIDSFRGSKYVQAEKNNMLKEIEEIAKKNIPILIIGLPCEIAGFKKYLGTSSENIFYCDLICYGPTSTTFFQKYLSNLRDKYRDSIQSISMRHKINRKERPYLYIEFKKGKSFLRPLYQTDIGLAFTIFGRKNCSLCKYNYLNSVADISLGDCVGNNFESFNNETGLSRVLIRTLRGKQLFMKLDEISFYETNGLSENFFANRECRRNDNTRKEFSNNFLSKGYKYAIAKKFSIIGRILNAVLYRDK